MSEPCEAVVHFGDGWWFACQLGAGHNGQHQNTGVSDDWTGKGSPYVIRWDAAPATVRGEVTGL